MASDRLDWFAMYSRDWLESESVLCMTAAERGIYVTLLCRAHANGDDTIPADERRIPALAMCSREEWEDAREAVLACWEEDPERPGRLYNRRLREERTTALEVIERGREQRSAAGRRSGEVRRERSSNGRFAGDQRAMNGRSAESDRPLNGRSTGVERGPNEIEHRDRDIDRDTNTIPGRVSGRLREGGAVEGEPAAEAGVPPGEDSRVAMREQPRDALEVPDGVDAEDWRRACECATLIEVAASPEAVVQGGTRWRAMGFLALAELCRDGGKPAWEWIVPTAEGLCRAGARHPQLARILAALRRYPDGAYPDTSSGVAKSRLAQAMRLLATVGEIRRPSMAVTNGAGARRLNGRQ